MIGTVYKETHYPGLAARTQTIPHDRHSQLARLSRTRRARPAPAAVATRRRAGAVRGHPRVDRFGFALAALAARGLQPGGQRELDRRMPGRPRAWRRPRLWRVRCARARAGRSGAQPHRPETRQRQSRLLGARVGPGPGRRHARDPRDRRVRFPGTRPGPHRDRDRRRQPGEPAHRRAPGRPFRRDLAQPHHSRWQGPSGSRVLVAAARARRRLARTGTGRQSGAAAPTVRPMPRHCMPPCTSR